MDDNDKRRVPLDVIMAKATLLTKLRGAHREAFGGVLATADGYPFIEYGPDGNGRSRLADAVNQASAQVEAILDGLMAEIAAWEPGGPPP
jgi:hypothetical protein